ncbi:Bifunctional ribokinase/ribose-5-phosphate isomerase A [Klebsiella spallanzanii]|uniref:Ribokinase n=1 Tax=Klebsiella spallanzanii TaxID=2587528 RepID=A0ABY6V8V0_9ENTR|nr:ribokinase [Klebsiella spallanzanii]VUS34721.1 Bifunctional ribokinase/ribose-5-phosphate isomerase A [Klebsiella spallanzanii]
MYRDTRREHIVRLLRSREECSVSDLAEHFSVTKETIRADLTWLQKRGIVTRHHGGVSLKKHLMQSALFQHDYVDMSLLLKQQQRGIGYLTSQDEKGRIMVGKVCILGSFNVDIVAKVHRFPRDGETLIARETTLGPGGKGANQALASHRAGAQIHFACKVGCDQFNLFARNHIESVGMGSFTLYETDNAATGCAVIYVNDEGENMIAISPGANLELTDGDIAQLSHFIAESDVFVVQMENNISATQLALKCAKELQVTTILNPAPWSPDVASLLPFSDIVTPNETEAAAMSGVQVHDIPTAMQAATHIYNAGQCAVIITMGKQGALIFDGQHYSHIPAFSAVAVDTTGAGDAFNGALAASLAKGESLVRSAWYASAFASLAVEQEGAANMPDDSLVAARMKQQNVAIQTL